MIATLASRPLFARICLGHAAPVAKTSAPQSTPFARQVPASSAPLLRMRFLWTNHLSVRHDFWPRPLSVGTHPTVTTCKPNTEKTPRFLRIREGSSLGRLVMTGVGALTRSLPLRRRDFRGAETLRQSAGVHGVRRCRFPAR